jgi:hypothetical protein
MGMGHALDVARSLHIAASVTGSGRVSEQDPAPGPTADGSRVTLQFSDGVKAVSNPF